MGSVDKTDQMLKPYNQTRKSYTWLKKLSIHIVSKMLLNAFKYNGEITQFKDFKTIML